MTLDEALLGEARAVRDRMVDAQAETDRATVSFQHAVRKLHAAGGSLREIADALQMSHQRVHQIVDIAAGKGALKEKERPKVPGVPLRCSFCDRSQAEVPKLIAGPNVCICDTCVDIAQETLATHVASAGGLTWIHPVEEVSKSVCSFCGKGSGSGVRLVAATRQGGQFTEVFIPGITICNECVDLCREILTEEGAR